MLLKMNKPEQASREMDLAVALWVALLTFFEKENLRFSKEKFKADFPDATGPLAWKNMRLKYQVEKLCENLDICDVRELLKCLEKDNKFTRNLNEANYRFNVLQLRADLKERLCDRFIPMYENLFTPEFREEYLEEYRRINEARSYLCPACMDHIDLNLAEMDHFFPKATYPTLAINSDNLIPICKNCNSPQVKGSKHPGDPNGNNYDYAGCLRDIVVPYNHSCDGIDEIVITFDRGDKIFSVKLTAQSQDCQRKVSNLVALYNLEERWTQYLRCYYKKVQNDIDKKFPRSGKINKKKLREYLMDYKDDIISNKWFNYFLEYHFIEWILDRRFDVLYDETVKRLEESVS